MEYYVTIHKKENILKMAMRLKMTMRAGIKRTTERQKNETYVRVERERKTKVEIKKTHRKENKGQQIAKL